HRLAHPLTGAAPAPTLRPQCAHGLEVQRQNNWPAQPPRCLLNLASEPVPPPPAQIRPKERRAENVSTQSSCESRASTSHGQKPVSAMSFLPALRAPAWRTAQR